MGLITVLAAEAERATQLHQEFRKLLALVASLKTGAIHPSQITVDLVQETWSLVQPTFVAPDDMTVREVPVEPLAATNGTGAGPTLVEGFTAMEFAAAPDVPGTSRLSSPTE